MSFSSNSSSSSSNPEVVSTPENSILDQLSGVAAGLANQMYNWAQGVFAQTSQITNQAVGNFFNTSQQMMGLSNNLTGQYNNLFAPENAQLVADANSYASPARMAVDMGQAGATQAQAGDAALHNSEEALKSYGIDPSSGRYAALDKASQVQNAANVAGAENTQRNADIATGQRLRSEAVQVGAQLPSAIANVNNTAIAANTGASNASLANANTGRNLMSLPNDFLKTATGIPLSPVAQRSQSGSSGSSSGPGNQNGGRSSGAGGGDGSGGAGSGAGGGRSSFMPDHSGAGSLGFTTPNFGGGNSFDANSGDFPVTDFGGDGSMSGGFDFGDPGQEFGATDAGGDGSMDGTFDFGSDPGTELSGGDTFSGNGADTSNPGGDFYAGDYSAPSDDYDMGGAYARGGMVHPQPRINLTRGGNIPAAASPSRGRQVDDIKANVNAGEFVMPRDVVAHKGSEFFQKLIAQSRKARMIHQARHHHHHQMMAR